MRTTYRIGVFGQVGGKPKGSPAIIESIIHGAEVNAFGMFD